MSDPYMDWAWMKGFAAARDGKDLSDNPFKKEFQPGLYGSWDEAWRYVKSS